MTARRRDYAAEGRLDWSSAKVGEPKPCAYCGQPALLRHPVSHRACHKVCSDAKASANLDRATADYAGAA